MQRWGRGNSLYLFLKASSEEDQEEVRRDRSPDRGNTGAHVVPHTMGVWRSQTCQVSCREESEQW